MPTQSNFVTVHDYQIDRDNVKDILTGKTGGEESSISIIDETPDWGIGCVHVREDIRPRKDNYPKEEKMAKKAKCPICSHPIEIAEFLEIGNTVDCMQCDSVLRLIELDPPALDVDSLDDFEEDASEGDEY